MKEGQGDLAFGLIKTQHSVPQDLGGKGIGTNPEELIVSAAASCFLITLAAIFQFKHVSYQRLEVDSTAEFEVTPRGPKMRAIHHQVKVYMDAKGETVEVEKHIKEAEEGCMISAALSGNVLISASGSIIQE
ncbi:OsmC family protein [Candidatus Regiella insecticola]|uniref:OsmC family protein n=1 Tax=Candidatus Regiella insecticola TaxID=138073 RepID=UPI0015970DBD|nr:OsmC family protein [Candidatus Regiella insecticola]